MTRDTSIAALAAWEAFDSRGTPTVACAVRLAGGAQGVATVPSGASTGTYEAHELRDGGVRFGGRGVRTAVRHVLDTLAPAVLGLEAGDWRGVDDVLCGTDGTQDLSRLGANAVLAVSVAVALAAADAAGVGLHALIADERPPLLPLPMVNIISGGAHAAGGIDFQDFLAVPVGASSFAEAIEWAWRTRHGTAELAAGRGLEAGLVADEGGLGPALPSNRAALELLVAGIERAGLQPGEQVAVAIDVAASQLAVPGGYRLRREGRTLQRDDMVEELSDWCRTYPVVSIEDWLDEDDWDGWSDLTQRWGDRLQLLGDDLFATNHGRLQRGVDDSVANAVLVKPNQAGSLVRAERVLRTAQAAGYATVVSARSGETEDAWLADLAVGWRTGQIKVGSLMRSERNAKWNRLLRIESEGGSGAEFAGPAALARRGAQREITRPSRRRPSTPGLS